MKKGIAFVCTLFLIIGIAGNTHSTTLGELFDGGTITVGDKLFSDWSLINITNTSAVAPNPNYDLIDVNPLLDQPLNPGIEFIANGQLSAANTDILDLYFSFDVESLSSSQLIKDNSLSINGYTFTGLGGLIEIVEDAYDPLGNLIVEKEAHADNMFSDFKLTDSAEFAPLSSITVYKNILVTGDFQGDYASLDSFEQRFSQTPEPGTLLLIGTGLIGLAGIRKKMKKS